MIIPSLVLLTVATMIRAHDEPRSHLSSSIAAGQVRGHVEIRTPLKAVSRQRGQRYRSRTRPAEQHESVQKETAPEVTNVVLYLEELDGPKSYPPGKPVQLIQQGMEFIPHVLPILRGTKVQIINKDNFYHNVFANSPAKRFNTGRQITDVEVTETFDQSGFIPVFCDVHLEMSAYVLVLENPYFAKPNHTGDYTIPNVPPGRYRITAWHEHLVSQSEEITVVGGGTQTVNFAL